MHALFWCSCLGSNSNAYARDTAAVSLVTPLFVVNIYSSLGSGKTELVYSKWRLNALNYLMYMMK